MIISNELIQSEGICSHIGVLQPQMNPSCYTVFGWFCHALGPLIPFRFTPLAPKDSNASEKRPKTIQNLFQEFIGWLRKWNSLNPHQKSTPSVLSLCGRATPGKRRRSSRNPPPARNHPPGWDSDGGQCDDVMLVLHLSKTYISDDTAP